VGDGARAATTSRLPPAPPVLLPPREGPPADARVRLGLAGTSPRVRLRPLSPGLRLVASLSGWRVLTGGT
jgi:hypothetical protein